MCFVFFFSSRRRHTRCALVTGVQTCALPIFDIFHVELGHRHVGSRIAVERHKLRQRTVADHHARCMGGAVARKAFQLHGKVDEALHLLVPLRSEEHTSELQSLMRISYAVFCLKKKTKDYTAHYNTPNP